MLHVALCVLVLVLRQVELPRDNRPIFLDGSDPTARAPPDLPPEFLGLQTPELSRRTGPPPHACRPDFLQLAARDPQHVALPNNLVLRE